MVTSVDSVALERQLLEKYKNYPNIHSAATRTTLYSNPSNATRLFQAGRNDDFLRGQMLNNQNLQKKVFGLGKIPEEEAGADANDEENSNGTKSHVIWWWEPPAHSIPKEFFSDSSMHGLKYLSQPKRHLCERIFWLVFFCTGVGAAGYLISGLWERYTSNPVIVTFEPADVDIGRITFPAVTICSMNKLRKTVAKELFDEYTWNSDLESGQRLYDARVLCDGQKSFSNYFDFAYERGRISTPQTNHYETNAANNNHSDDFAEFVRSVTPSCDQLIRLCRWAGEPQNCSKLFKDVITEFGLCCTFNGLPDHMIQKGLIQNTTKDNNETEDWKKWVELGRFELPEGWNETYPRTQARPGSLYGLSISLDANVTEYFCSSSDSVGFRIMFHSPAELPPISEFGMSVGLGNEVYMKVIPELILADDEIKPYDKAKRLCMLRREGNLEFYNQYTYLNCFDECITKAILKNCNCSFYYMAHLAKVGTRPCDANPEKDDYSCSKRIKHKMSQHLRQNCSQCEALCSDIVYRTETTMTKLQPGIWQDIDPSKMEEPPAWTSHEISIVHIFYGDLSTVPKIRKALYGVTDIIANIGGLLGLCLGFSVLSAVEIVYFFTCRACLKWTKEHRGNSNRTDVENIDPSGHGHPGEGTLRRMVFGLGRSDPNRLNRVITLDSNALELRSHYNNNI